MRLLHLEIDFYYEQEHTPKEQHSYGYWHIMKKTQRRQKRSGKTKKDDITDIAKNDNIFKKNLDF